MGALKASGGLRIGRSFNFKASRTFETGKFSFDCVASRPLDCTIAVISLPVNVPVFLPIDSETDISLNSPVLSKQVFGSFTPSISTDLVNVRSFRAPYNLDASESRITRRVDSSMDEATPSVSSRSG